MTPTSIPITPLMMSWPQPGTRLSLHSADGYSVTIDSMGYYPEQELYCRQYTERSANPESDDNWPLRLVGSAVRGKIDFKIVSIKLVGSEPGKASYTLTPEADAAYTAGKTPEGINFMTVNNGVTGFKYFTVGVTPVVSHDGKETVVFTHLRNGSQLGINATRADFDQVNTAQASFNVKAGDVVKVYIVDELTNDLDHNL